ncbi:M14 family metallopeptidase [Shewanella waksmanii]|uniref:M14 family metallopeptidase n=1 Tax=Shewanella waksmanii TaxID=213783 RepID=UPI0004AFE418|nr:M14 family metallocarboxypeptidase [Shewanella waksmanii]
MTTDKQSSAYGIGSVGQKWGKDERTLWLSKQSIKRSYQQEVVAKLDVLPDSLVVSQYGELPYNERNYPLFVVKNRVWDQAKPTVLVTGGVHGYETSGVQGAIRFLETQIAHYPQFNFVVAPCVSPWGYETINRWNPNAVDPNRSFMVNSPAPESAALMAMVASLGIDLIAHIDLHETTDTDNSEFRPALAARDAVAHTNWNIPDGFYLVGDSENPCDDFQQAIIKAVSHVTHIAPADDNDKLIGVDVSQFGVINYATKALSLCTGFSDAQYNTTTEVYPDSPLVDDENCVAAQVTAITSGLDYMISQHQLG